MINLHKKVKKVFIKEKRIILRIGCHRHSIGTELLYTNSMISGGGGTTVYSELESDRMIPCTVESGKTREDSLIYKETFPNIKRNVDTRYII